MGRDGSSDLWLGRLECSKRCDRHVTQYDSQGPVAGPKVEDLRRYRAYTDIVRELGEMDIEVTEAVNNARILEFAQAQVAAA